jgi:dipeptidyl-peptidase-4
MIVLAFLGRLPAAEVMLLPRETRTNKTIFVKCQDFTDAAVEQQEQDVSPLTNEEIFGGNPFAAETPQKTWFAQNSQLISNDGGTLTLENPFTGEKQTLIKREWLIPKGETSPLTLDSWTFSEDMTQLLIFTNSKRVWRHNTRGDYWLFDKLTYKLRKLGGNAAPSTLMFAKLSPNGRNVAYVRENNIYVENLEIGVIKPLTTNGGDRFINGTFDWVYEEEFTLTDGFRWSPDGRFIAFWEFDTEGEPVFTMLDNTGPFYPVTKTFKYPRAGETNAAVRVGVVDIETGETRWMKIPGDPRENYITAVLWGENDPFSRSDDSDDLMIQQFNRPQNRMTLYRADPKTGETVPVLCDTDDRWIDLTPIRPLYGDYLFESERNGVRQLFLLETSTTIRSRRTAEEAVHPVEPVTPPDMDVIGFAAFSSLKDAGKYGVYFYASPGNATQRYLYHVDLDGRNCRRVTPLDQPGTHHYSIAANGGAAIHTFSQFGVPPTVELVELPSHKRIQLLTDNAELKEKLKKQSLGETEFFQVEVEPGVTLDGWCIYPPNCFPVSGPKKRYPVLVYVYGEPAGQTVLDSWGGNTYLWHQMLAQNGIAVVSFDNRGTPAPKGRDWRKSIYKKVGILGAQDQAQAIRKFLETRSFLSDDHVGIWGWSGGGSMTLHAMLQYPEIYSTGIAVAPVPDERYYDTIYQERYMGNPRQGDEEAYRQNSPIHYAGNLTGNLLLIHGTGDDNCHYQTMEIFINELIRWNREFTMMAYPGRSHGIFEGDGTTLHLRALMTRFLQEHLPVEEMPAEEMRGTGW